MQECTLIETNYIFSFKSLPCDALRAMCKRVIQSSCSLADVDKWPMLQEKENKSY